jgi:hypothetical protein
LGAAADEDVCLVRALLANGINKAEAMDGIGVYRSSRQKGRGYYRAHDNCRGKPEVGPQPADDDWNDRKKGRHGEGSISAIRHFGKSPLQQVSKSCR